MKIAIINQKGGVGKTTVAVNLAYSLAQAGRSVLLVDIDSQAHASVIYCEDLEGPTVGDVLASKDLPLSEAIRPARTAGQDIEGLSVVPSNIHLALTAEQLASRVHREKILHTKLEPVKSRFDYILLDCPPNLGTLSINAILTAGLILIPTTFGRYSLDGIADLFDLIQAVKEGNPARYAILRNMFEARNTRSNAFVDDQLKAEKNNLLKTVIRKNEAINQAQMTGQPVALYEPKSNGAKDFADLTAELLNYEQ